MSTGVGVQVSLGGAASFRNQMALLAQETKNFDAQLKAVTSQFGTTERSMENLTKQNGVLTSSIQSQRDKMSLLDNELQKQRTRLTELADAAKKAADEHGNGSAEAVKAANAYTKQATVVERLETQYNNTEAAVNQMTRQLDDNEQTIRDIERGYNDAGNEVDEFGREVEKAGNKDVDVSKLAKAFGAVEIAIGLAKKALNTLTKNISGAFNRIDAEENYTNTLRRMLDTEEQVADAVKGVRDIVQDTGYTFADASGYVQRFTLTQKASVEESTRWTQGILNAVSTYAGGASDVADTVADAFGKMVSSGKISTQQIDRIVQQGIPVLEYYAEATGSSVEEVRSLISKGELDAVQFISTVTTAFEQGAGSYASLEGAARDAGASWEATFSNLTSRIQAGIAEGIKKLDEGLQEIGLPSIREIIDEIGTRAKEMLVSLAERLPALIVKARDLFEAVKPLAPLILAIASAITVLTTTAKLAEYIKNVKSGIIALKVALSALMAHPVIAIIALVVAAIAGIVVGIKHLWDTNEDFRNAVTKIWEKIKEVVGTVVNAIVGFFTVTIPQALNKLKDFFLSIPEWWRNLWQGIFVFFENIINSVIRFFTETIPAFIGRIIQWFNELPYKIGYAIGQVLGKILAFGVSAWEWVTTELPKIITGIIEWFAELPGRVWEWLKSTVSRIVEWGIEALKTAVDAAKSLVISVVDWFKQLPGKVWTWLKETVSKIVQWGKDAVKSAVTGAKDLVTNVIDTIKSLPDKVKEIGTNLVKGLWDGITGMGTWLKDKIFGFADGIVSGFKSAFGIHSPSRVLRDLVGKMLPPGIAVGFEKAMPAAIRDMKASASSMVDALQTTIPVALDTVQRTYAPPYGAEKAATPSQSRFDIHIDVHVTGTEDTAQWQSIAERIAGAVDEAIQGRTQRGLAARGAL